MGSDRTFSHWLITAAVRNMQLLQIFVAVRFDYVVELYFFFFLSLHDRNSKNNMKSVR